VLRGGDLREPVLEAPPLHLQEGDQRPHLLLHRLEPDEGVELGLQLLERARVLDGWPPQVEAVGPVGFAAQPLPHVVAQDLEAADDVVEWIRHERALPVAPESERPTAESP